MNLYTAWKMLRDRLAGSHQETPKKRRQPRQPKPATRIQRTIDDAFLDAKIREIDRALTNQHGRISELEQIEQRRREENQGG